MAEFVTVIKEFKRMCCSEVSCEECLYGLSFEEDKCEHWLTNHPEEAEKIIMDWVAEHPVETMKDRFFKMFPNAPKKDNGAPESCPHHLGWAEDGRCNDFETCLRCWNRPYEERSVNND